MDIEDLWGVWRASWERLGASWERLGACWGRVGGLQGRPGREDEASSWGVLERPGRHLGGLGAVLVAFKAA